MFFSVKACVHILYYQGSLVWILTKFKFVIFTFQLCQILWKGLFGSQEALSANDVETILKV